MNSSALRRILEGVRSRKLSPDEALSRLRHLPFEDLGFAKLDHHRALRHGMPEVIFGQGKTPGQVAKIFARLASHHHESNILATRATEEQFCAVQSALARSIPSDVVIPSRPEPRGARRRQARDLPSSETARIHASPESQLEYRSLARCITLRRDQKHYSRGTIAIVSAGTSDIPVAEEAVATAELMGNKVEALYDVGVAGIHRLLAHRGVLAKARVIIVCAGMEGALPSVVGGLVGVPVIAVPTSVGYGASFDGLAALLGMLNSCASNVSVVNIDNGFGAAYVASLINRG
jgi:pyridinium-3,5-biscarboxylic acid mononucleotide synthase